MIDEKDVNALSKVTKQLKSCLAGQKRLKVLQKQLEGSGNKAVFKIVNGIAGYKQDWTIQLRYAYNQALGDLTAAQQAAIVQELINAATPSVLDSLIVKADDDITKFRGDLKSLMGELTNG